MLRALFVLALLALVPSCGNSARPPFVVHIVTPLGTDPLIDPLIARGVVTILVRQLDMPVQTETGTITSGRFDAIDVPITSYGVITRIEVTIDDDDDPDTGPVLIGATPPFVPLGYGSVNVVVGPPSTCETLVAPTLSTPRVQPGLVSLEANLISIGGEESDGTSSTAVDSFTPVQLTENVDFEDRPALADVGAGGAVRIGTDGTVGIIAMLALSEVRSAVLFFLDQNHASAPDVDLSPVHAGAGPLSALVSLGDGSAAIVGGRLGDAPVDGITWVDINGHATTSELAIPRVRPAAVRIGGHLLVAGGQEEGRELFELVSITDPAHPSVASFGPTDDRRQGAVLAADSGSDNAWLGFGEDDAGTLLTTTYEITGCPSACEAMPSTPIDHPRRGFATALRSDELLVIGGADENDLPSSAVDRIRFASGAPIVEPLGPLFSARTRAGATHMSQGIVLVAGGQVERGGDMGLRPVSDFEICFPDELDGL